MGFREDVPLDGFINLTPFASEVLLGQPDAGVRLGGTPSFFGIGTPVSPHQQDEIPIYSQPFRTGGGPAERSTSLELEPWPSVVWDVNGYYRALGVDFRATRKQLLTAYLQLNGQEDEYLTYVFKQLLDPEIRRKYDAAPFGGRFLDLYVMEDLKALARRLADRWHVHPEDVMRSWGFEYEDDASADDLELDGAAEEIPDFGQTTRPRSGQCKDPVDIPQESREDKATPTDHRPKQDEWPYSYYLWKVKLRHCELDIGPIMRRWQEAIASECLRQRVSIRFAVGLTSAGRKEGARFITMSVGGATVAFISADHIDDIDDIAPQVVHRLTHSGI